MSELPTISIAMATYNGERFIEEQLESLLAQECPPVELQVGDDGSNDATEEIVKHFAKRAPFPVNFHHNSQRLGYGENFLRTATRCRGEWIAFSDQDDVWLPQKLSRCAQIIAEGPADLNAIAHDALVVDESGRVLGPLLDPGPIRVESRWSLQPPWTWYGCCFVFRRTLITDISPDVRAWAWHSKGAPDAHDAWVPLLASAVGSVVITGEQLVLYRRHSENLSPFLRPESAKQRFSSTLRSNAAAHRHQAERLQRVAELFKYHSKNVAREDWRRSLHQAAGELIGASKMFERRADAYTLPTLSSRLSAIGQLLKAGSYSGSRQWGFARRSVVKDIVYAFFATATRRRRAQRPPD